MNADMYGRGFYEKNRSNILFFSKLFIYIVTQYFYCRYELFYLILQSKYSCNRFAKLTYIITCQYVMFIFVLLQD